MEWMRGGNTNLDIVMNSPRFQIIFVLAIVAGCSLGHSQGVVEVTPANSEMLLHNSCQADIARQGTDELVKIASAKLMEVAKDKSGEWQPKLDVNRALSGMAKQF